MEKINKLKEYITEEKKFLPKEIQEVLSTYEWIADIKNIGEKHKLIEEEILSLQTEVALILLGITKASSFSQNIKDNVVVNEQEAKEIEKEINEVVFAPITKKLEELIKRNMPNKKLSFFQEINFILSGGDYTAFIREPVKEKSAEKIPKPNTSFKNSRIEDIKSKFTI